MKSRFRNVCNKHVSKKKVCKELQWLILLLLVIAALSVFVFRQYVIDGFVLCSKGLWSDLLRANLPTYYQLYDSILEGGNFWSWNMGLGTSMFSHADTYFDPFTYIVFLFGRTYIPNMMIFVLIVKIMCEGMSFFIYLKYFQLDERAVLLASVVYAFSGYSLIIGNNFALGTVLVYGPIVFLGIEKWIDTGRVRTLIVSLFFTCIYSYYFFFVLGLLSVIYVCVRAYQKRKPLMPKLVTLAGIAVLVILLSSFALLPQIELTLSSDRVNGAKDVTHGLGLWIPQLKVFATAVIRSVSGDLLGNPVTGEYRGSAYFQIRDYFQVSCFTTSFLPILAVQYWINEKKYRKHFLAIAGIASILILFPIISFILNAFATVNARWMFMITILECILVGVSVDSMVKHGGIHGKGLFTGILASFALIVCGVAVLSLGTTDFGEYFFSYLYHGRKFIYVLCLEYTLLAGIYLLLQFSKTTYRKAGIYLLMTVALLIDEGVNYYHCYGVRQSVSEYSEEERSSYEDTSAKMIRQIQEADPSFFRINKTFDSVVDDKEIPSQNDAMAQRYFGLKNYNSLNNASYIKFLQTLGIYVAAPPNIPDLMKNDISPSDISGSQLNYINGVGNRYDLMSYLGVKYFMTDESELKLPENFRFVKKVNHIRLYENENYYPLAFVNEKQMSFEQFKTLTDHEKDVALLQYTIVDGKQSTDVKISQNKQLLKKLAESRRQAFQLDDFSQDRVMFRIEVGEQAEYLSFSIPYTADWHVYVDGKEVRTCKVNVSLLGAEITKGVHEVEIRYQPKAVTYGLILTGIGCLLLLLLWKKAANVIVWTENTVEVLMAKILCVSKNEYVRTYVVKIITASGSLLVACSVSAVSMFVFFPSACMKKQLGTEHYLFMTILFVFTLGILFYVKNRRQHTLADGTAAQAHLQKRAKRESNIELCRIICMLFIIAHHCVLHGGAFEMEGMSANRVFALFLVPIGKLCFDCFLAISCWHLVDQKFSSKRFIKMWTQVLFYSVAFAMAAIGFGVSLKFSNWVSVWLPMTGNSHGFAASYLAFYLLLPFLSMASEKLNKKQARWLLLLLLYFETGSKIIGYFSSYVQPLSSELLLFVLFYVLALNLKRWPLDICSSKKIMFGVFFAIWIGLWMVRFLYIQSPNHGTLQFIMNTMYDESSITNIIGGTALFFFFKNLKIKKNVMMNYFAAGTFGILLMHDHNFFRTVLWKNILHTQEWYYASWLPAAVIAVVIWIYAVGFFIEQIRLFGEDILCRFGKRFLCPRYITVGSVAVVSLCTCAAVWMMPAKLIYTSNMDMTKIVGAVETGDIYEQIFTPQGNKITGIAVKVGTYMQENTSILKCELIDMQSQSVKNELKLDTAKLKDNEYIRFKFPSSTKIDDGSTYAVRMTAEAIVSGDRFTFYRSNYKKESEDHGYAMVNGKKKNFDLGIQVFGK